jgi:hypothetical protein
VLRAKLNTQALSWHVGIASDDQRAGAWAVDCRDSDRRLADRLGPESVRAAVAVAYLCLAPCHADELRVFYDAIEMKAITQQQDRTLQIQFIDPPVTLREIGVAAGQPLVRGKWVEDVFEGVAIVYGPGCAREYPVRGVVDQLGDLVVIGPAPQDCDASSPLVWSKQSIMRFEPVRTLVKKKKEKPKREAEKPKPKPRPRPAPQQPQPQYPYGGYQQPQPWQWR